METVTRKNSTGYHERLKSLTARFKEIESYQNLKQLRLTKEQFNQLWVKENVNSKNGFWNYYEEYLEIQKVLCSKYTIKNYTTVKNTWKEFEEENNLSLSYEAIDNSMFEKFSVVVFSKERVFS